ncbi:hypothetical protein GCM10025864_22550 [Luteimicrobium album]|uniref:DUF3618 domain-containing protein n=1 Tax=Luteimicrobium album TaxID=1054550 RepID=A0ABQ6I2J8_9MICO|nr:hypothetical protein GCM10025864_22550 [Luteimicrobium album]
MSTKETQLQEELAQARAELASTVDELSAHLDPRAQASRFAASTKQAATDTAGLFTGTGCPARSTGRGTSRCSSGWVSPSSRWARGRSCASASSPARTVASGPAPRGRCPRSYRGAADLSVEWFSAQFFFASSSEVVAAPSSARTSASG